MPTYECLERSSGEFVQGEFSLIAGLVIITGITKPGWWTAHLSQGGICPGMEYALHNGRVVTVGEYHTEEEALQALSEVSGQRRHRLLLRGEALSEEPKELYVYRGSLVTGYEVRDSMEK